MVIPLPENGDQKYTCKWLDGGDCTAYDARPGMCSSFPYGKRCEQGKLCASNDARRGLINRPDKSRLRLPLI